MTFGDTIVLGGASGDVLLCSSGRCGIAELTGELQPLVAPVAVGGASALPSRRRGKDDRVSPVVRLGGGRQRFWRSVSED